MDSVRAYTVGKDDSGTWTRSITTIAADALGDGDVLIEVEFSGINYKDGLASTESGKIARINPLVPGVDLAGRVVESADPSVAVGSSVIAHGYDIGVAHHGGYATHARVPAGWVVPMPAGLDARTAMLRRSASDLCPASAKNAGSAENGSTMENSEPKARSVSLRSKASW